MLKPPGSLLHSLLFSPDQLYVLGLSRRRFSEKASLPEYAPWQGNEQCLGSAKPGVPFAARLTGPGLFCRQLLLWQLFRVPGTGRAISEEFQSAPHSSPCRDYNCGSGDLINGIRDGLRYLGGFAKSGWKSGEVRTRPSVYGRSCRWGAVLHGFGHFPLLYYNPAGLSVF